MKTALQISEFRLQKPTRKLRIKSSMFRPEMRFLAGGRLIATFHGGPCDICLPDGKSFSWSAWYHEGVETRVFREDACKIICIFDHHYVETDDQEDFDMSVYGPVGATHYKSAGTTVPAHAELPLDIREPRAIVVGDELFHCNYQKTSRDGCRCEITKGDRPIATLKRGLFSSIEVGSDANLDELQCTFLALMAMKWRSDPVAEDSFSEAGSANLEIEPQMSVQSFDQFMKSFYRREFDEGRELRALRFATSDCHLSMCDAHALDLVEYFLSRIALGQPELLRELENIFRTGSSRQQDFLFRVLVSAGDENTSEFLRIAAAEIPGVSEAEVSAALATGIPRRPADPLTRPVTHAGDLDFLWVEFFVTGNDRTIRRIVRALDRPDHIREVLNDWLRETPSGLLGVLRRWRSRNFALNAEAILGISLDAAGQSVATEEDLDCLCHMDGVNISNDRRDAAARILPVRLDHQQLDDVAIKAAAKWSLAANALYDDTIRSICEEEAGLRDGRVKLALTDILEVAGPTTPTVGARASMKKPSPEKEVAEGLFDE